MARPSVVGQEVFDRTTALVAEGKTRTEAFDLIAKERGQKAGTVAANYYRVARKEASADGRSPNRPRRRPTPAKPPAVPEAGMAAQLEACIQQMVDEAVDRRMQRLLT